MVTAQQLACPDRRDTRHGKATICQVSWLAVGLASLLTGCASVKEHSLTCRLWTTADFRSFNQPASQPHLALYEASPGNRVLVQYDSVSDWPTKAERKAYFLNSVQAGMKTRTKPEFVKPSLAEGLQPIPIYPAVPDMTNAPAPLIPHAVAALVSGSFTLYQSNGPGQTISLPVYAEHSGTTTQVALTPLAVAGDTVVVVAVAGFVFVVELCRGNFSFSP